MKRKIDNRIRDFLLNDKRSLLITGARQVGKTYSIRKAGKECFENVVEINFVEHPEAICIAMNIYSVFMYFEWAFLFARNFRENQM